MRTRSFPFLLLLVLTGCVGNVSPPPPPVEISGRVLRSLCETVGGVTVQVLDGEASVGPTGPDGHFALTVPQRAALLVTGPGRVPTLTFERTFSAGSTSEEAASVPEDVAMLVHSLAGFELGTQTGTVVLAAMDGAPLPISDVEVTLLSPEGEPVPANARRRFVTFTGTVPTIIEAQGTGPTGIAGFFNVPPGRYRLRVAREGYSFTEQVVPVRAGTITLDLVRGEGTGAAFPVPFPGVVTAFPLFPLTSRQAAPLPDASVTLVMEDGATFETRTEADGGYLLGLPRVGQWFDVTARYPGYEPTRSKQACAGHFAYQHFALDDAFYSARFRRYALGARPTEADAGTVLVSVVEGSTPVLGASLALSPSLAEPFYGQDSSQPWSCVRGTCGDGGACAAGTRCEGGRCVLGAPGSSLCQACDATPCAAGFAPTSASGSGCFCLPAQGSCTRDSASCEPGTYCWAYSLTSSACVLYTSLFTSTGQFEGRAHPVMFANVPEGLYFLDAARDGGALGEPIRLRVSAGVTNNFSLP